MVGGRGGRLVFLVLGRGGLVRPRMKVRKERERESTKIFTRVKGKTNCAYDI